MEEAVCVGEFTRGQVIAAWASERGDDFTNGRARRAYVRWLSAAEREEWTQDAHVGPDEAPLVAWCGADHPDAKRCWVVMPREVRL